MLGRHPEEEAEVRAEPERRLQRKLSRCILPSLASHAGRRRLVQAPRAQADLAVNSGSLPDLLVTPDRAPFLSLSSHLKTREL